LSPLLMQNIVSKLNKKYSYILPGCIILEDK
jgi:hypothetical protein